MLKLSFQDTCAPPPKSWRATPADGGPAVLIGLPWMQDGACHNAYALLDGGRIAAVRFKVDLPNYGVFDEKRVFHPGPAPGPVAFRGVRLGLPICEDIWAPDVVESLSETGAEILLSPNGSPYWRGKDPNGWPSPPRAWSKADCRWSISIRSAARMNWCSTARVLSSTPIVRSPERCPPSWKRWPEPCSAAKRRLGLRGGAVAPQLETTRPITRPACSACAIMSPRTIFPESCSACPAASNSALCAAMAADALGPSSVHAIMLPYRFTSDESLTDAADCAKALGVRYDVLPVAAAVEGVEAALAPLFAGTPRGVTEENIQARARGLILMSVSNKFGPMLVTTGNKSEMSVGYATLYGDMNGGFNPIKDLYKTQVFRLCGLRNHWKPDEALGPDGPVIPQNIIDKPPTAELRENQKDRIRCRPMTRWTTCWNVWSRRTCASSKSLPAGTIPKR